MIGNAPFCLLMNNDINNSIVKGYNCPRDIRDIIEFQDAILLDFLICFASFLLSLSPNNN